MNRRNVAKVLRKDVEKLTRRATEESVAFLSVPGMARF